MTPTLHLILSALLGSVLGGGVLYKIVLSALENHMRREFQSREDARGMSHRINDAIGNLRDKTDTTAGMFVSLDDRVGDLEAKTSLIEERITHQWQRVAEQMSQTARTIEGVTKRIERITDAQQNLALQMERMKRSA